jgi:hypothetical protein
MLRDAGPSTPFPSQQSRLPTNSRQGDWSRHRSSLHFPRNDEHIRMCKASAEVVLCSLAPRFSIHGPPRQSQYSQALMTSTNSSVGPRDVSTQSDGCDARLATFSLSKLILTEFEARNPFVQITDVSRGGPTAEAS